MSKIVRDGNALVFYDERRQYVGSSALGIVTIREMTNTFDDFGQLYFKSHYIGDANKNENSFTLTAAVKGPLKDGLKHRNMMAHITLTDSDVRAMYELVQERSKQYNTLQKPLPEDLLFKTQ